jgi:hypothetical protein
MDLANWFKDNWEWASWAAVIIGAITMGIAWKVRPLINYIEFLSDEWQVERLNKDMIRIKAQVAIASPVNVIGKGCLKLNNSKITLKMTSINQTDLGIYKLEFDGKYMGSYQGIGIIKLKVNSMKKTKKKTRHMAISILEKIEPPDIMHPSIGLDL